MEHDVLNLEHRRAGDLQKGYFSTTIVTDHYADLTGIF